VARCCSIDAPDIVRADDRFDAQSATDRTIRERRELGPSKAFVSGGAHTRLLMGDCTGGRNRCPCLRGPEESKHS
jgi:hypothetical protein